MHTPTGNRAATKLRVWPHDSAAANHEFETVHFDSAGTLCEAWLFRPATQQATPLVVMAHGFAGEKSFGLAAFARHFASRGMAALIFDYRHFGGSGGMPRNLVSLRRQRQDWQAALTFAASLPGIDQSRIALWGTSFAGGHALTCAVENPGVAAVVAQTPMLDVLGSLRGYTVRYGMKAMWHAVRDLLRAATRRAPHLVPVVGSGRTFAVMNKPGCEEGYRRMVPNHAAWSNTCPARILITSLLHRPTRDAWRVKCPVLMLLASNDQLVPRRVVHAAAARMNNVNVLSLAGDHFTAYPGGESFQRALQLESDFLEQHLFDVESVPMSTQRQAASDSWQKAPARKSRAA